MDLELWYVLYLLYLIILGQYESLTQRNTTHMMGTQIRYQQVFFLLKNVKQYNEEEVWTTIAISLQKGSGTRLQPNYNLSKPYFNIALHVASLFS